MKLNSLVVGLKVTNVGRGVLMLFEYASYTNDVSEHGVEILY